MLLRISPVPALCVCCLVTCQLGLAQPYGIDSRAENTSLLIDELPADTPGTMARERVFAPLTFDRGVLMIEVPDGSGRMLVVEQGGTIQSFYRDNPTQKYTFLDIRSRVRDNGEQGLLGLAIDPDYATSGEFYVYYSWRDNNCTTCPTRVSRFTNDNPAGNDVDEGSEEEILRIDQPYGNHNGGMIAFGPDGMLYISLGDGGSGGDPLNSGQDSTTILGSLLRIDVGSAPDPGLAYKVPPDNPFYSGGPDGTATRKEIYALGLRNMWRFSFSMLDGRLFGGDVGQGAYEEIDVITAGGNYGWRFREGMHCYNPPSDCSREYFIDPIVEYGRSLGRSVTGGYVYAGTRVTELYGMYIYGDYVSRRVWGLRYDGDTVSGPYVLIDNVGFSLAGFGQDADGEVYMLSHSNGGAVYRLTPQSPSGASDFPLRLSELPALYAAGKGIDQTTDGIIPYEPSAKLWSDGAHKERYIALPHLDTIGYTTRSGWDFGEDALLVKNFILPLDERDPEGSLKRFETRLLMKKDGVWHGFSYEWDDAETDAVLLRSSKQRAYTVIDEQGASHDYNWLYPSSAQCLQCHTEAANGVLGLNTPQMNFDFTYPASGVTDNQLRTYDHIAFFEQPLPAPPNALPRMPETTDETADLRDRARAYLAANCAMCHQPGGPAPSTIDLRWEVSAADMNAIGETPLNGSMGIADARIIAAGDPDRSVLLKRMNIRGAGQMPPLATERIDEEAVELIRRYILDLTSNAVFQLY